MASEDLELICRLKPMKVVSKVQGKAAAFLSTLQGCAQCSLLWLGRLSGAPAAPYPGGLPPAGTAFQPHSEEIAELGRLVGFCLLILTGYQLIAE